MCNPVFSGQRRHGHLDVFLRWVLINVTRFTIYLSEIFFVIMPDLIPALPRDEFSNSTAILSRKISSEYKEHELNLIGILKEAFIFLSDLVRKLNTPIKIDFLHVASYGSNSSTSGKIQKNKEIETVFK